MQEVVIPWRLQNSTDVWFLVNAGSGMSIAYLVAVLHRIDPTKNYTQAVCVVVCYEAALQLLKTLTDLAVFMGIKIGLAVKSDNGNF